MQPVGGAVTKDDLLWCAADQLRQQAAEPLWHLSEVVVADPVRCGLQRGRPFACLHGRVWQRALMSRVEPRPAVERTELGRGNAQ